MYFSELNLCSEILLALDEKGYETPTKIQAEAIPKILSGCDILGGSQTGTGKTAAFTLPILEQLKNRKSESKKPLVLILTPTRELAAQVHESIITYGKNLCISSSVAFGGVNIKPQVRALKQGSTILVATPGRLLDLAGQGVLNLSQIETLVLDEADRMLDMGFIHDIRKVMKLIPPKRQTLFFSATYSIAIKKLADNLLTNPHKIEVTRKNTAAETVKQSMYNVPKSRKRDLLAHLIIKGDWNQVLVFTKTKHAANRLAKFLCSQNISAEPIHGNKSQSARTRALNNFKSYKTRVLVATDIAARGIDIDQLPHVVNYELPQVAEDYIHRIGRTGRAGSSGEAISLIDKAEKSMLKSIERLMKRSIYVNRFDDFSLEPKEHNRPSENKDRERSPRQRDGQNRRRNDNKNRRKNFKKDQPSSKETKEGNNGQNNQKRATHSRSSKGHSGNPSKGKKQLRSSSSQQRTEKRNFNKHRPSNK